MWMEISLHHWLSGLAFSPFGSIWLARWLDPLTEAEAPPLMACFHSNAREVRVRWSTQEPFPNKHSFIVPLSVFSGIKCKCVLNQERQTEQKNGRTSRPVCWEGKVTLSLPPFIRLPSVSLGFYLQYVNWIWKMKVKPSWSWLLWPLTVSRNTLWVGSGVASNITHPPLVF